MELQRAIGHLAKAYVILMDLGLEGGIDSKQFMHLAERIDGIADELEETFKN